MRRGESRAKSFFLTLAYQLALYDEEFARQITAALELHPDAANRGQYTKLIAEPLQDLLGVKGKLILVVIDALDECEPHDAVGLLTLFASEVHKMPRLKVFITTRPERYIRNILARNRDHEIFQLQEKLFIVASTAARFILNGRWKQLSTLLEGVSPDDFFGSKHGSCVGCTQSYRRLG